MKDGVLKTYTRVHVYRPDEANVRRWILPDEKKIYINTAAPEGKIDRLVFGKENGYGK